MAVKKSELYSTLWASCDQLRGGMEPTEYKDYVLLMLFVRYVSDKAKIDKNITIPKGSSFDDFVTFKGKSDIGEKINIAIIQVKPSTQNKPLYPIFIIIKPPKAGPAANPKLIANRTSVKALVLFSGFA